ncbi:hypothetical protein CU098_007965 [Rhizopus stolonifer]|uniref:Chromo domain-containing protein n=1 Tax=Rhizopus stolonifer TaxID=4846 RepID=A0A367KKT0_RHIST|nr:hypothetical protein CU098_007965 [Rhizopus stolonifer]
MTLKSKTTPPSPAADDAVYEVEAIVDHRRSLRDDKKIDYLIKWKDYDSSSNTWEREANIYSKELVDAYWSTIPYTMDAFRHNKHNTTKKRTHSPSPARLERSQWIHQVKMSEIKAAPPLGYMWKDIEAIVNVFKTEPNIFFAEVKWPGIQVNTYIPTRIIKKYNPIKVSLRIQPLVITCLS